LLSVLHVRHLNADALYSAARVADMWDAALQLSYIPVRCRPTARLPDAS
jgi:hypothetical protein